MRSYLELCDYVLSHGEVRDTRAGPARSVFSTDIEFDMSLGQFPLISTRELNYKPVFGELAAFLKGATTLKAFKDYGCHYWDKNAKAWDSKGERVGRIYGAQWRDWNQCTGSEGIDQIKELVEGIRDDPNGRRHIVTAWNPGELTDMCLPPCHMLFQCYARNKYLDMLVTQRSVDLCLGLPSDLVLYGALLALLSRETGRMAGRLKFNFGDTHIYLNHTDQILQQMRLNPRSTPRWNLAPESRVDNFQPQHLEILNYNPLPKINYELNV